MTQPDLFDMCAARHGGNANSVAAHKRTNAETDRALVLSAIAASRLGMTCDELEQFLDMPHQSCSARVSELKMKGLIQPSGKRPTRTGCNAAVMVVVN